MLQTLNCWGIFCEPKARPMLQYLSRDEAAGALHQFGAISVTKSTPGSLEAAELNTHKINFLQRFQDLKYDEALPNSS
ncbi:hypothetical protein MKW98_020690 [Papaver atlanticum]|uniref:Uncharacterized protein n=1 Tax=Papaver atlanticum TaxID=357466 RepID=A0AAD4TF89_9MAGN|nr:hypothetical protein MKW98_020690 [Papaver atlanticum]